MARTELIAQKGDLKLRGIIVGLGNDKAFTQGTSQKNNRGWKRINFGVKTDKDSTVYVELFGSEGEKAYAYNKDKKHTMDIPWSQRLTKKLPSGYNLIQSDWDKIDKIRSEFKDGDSVTIVGEIQFSEYNEKLQQRFVLKQIYKTKEPINFESEDFEPVCKFNQELTVTAVEKGEDDGKLHLYAYVLRKVSKDAVEVTPAMFVVNIEKNKKFAKTIAKMKFGDTFRASGLIHSKVIKEVIEQEDEYGTVDNVITTVIKELEITGIYKESIELKKYKEKDFEEALEAKRQKEAFNADTKNNDDDAYGITGGEDDTGEDHDELPFEL